MNLLLVLIIFAVFGCNPNPKSNEIHVLTAVEKKINVDADTSDWIGITPETVNQISHLWLGQGMYEEYWKGPYDHSFTWRAAWNGNKLYFLYVVTDDKISPFDHPETWLNDCIEICLDPELTHGVRKSNINGTTKLAGYETHFLPMQPPHAFLHDENLIYNIAKPQDDDFRTLWNGEMAVSYTKTGYIFELAFSIPGKSLQKNSIIGLETAVCDDDGNSRKSLLTWTGIQTDYWISMDNYGVLTLQ
jgi:hypothetical protein